MKKILYLLTALILMVPFHSSEAGGNEGSKYKTNKIRDLALIYQGGVQRIDWTPDQFVPYVTHQFAVNSVDAYVHNHNAFLNHFRLHKAGLAHCSDDNICLL